VQAWGKRTSLSTSAKLQPALFRANTLHNRLISEQSTVYRGLHVVSFHFNRSYLKANKVSKSGDTRKVKYAHYFWKYADAVDWKLSKLVHACRSYSLPKLAHVLDTVYKALSQQLFSPCSGFTQRWLVMSFCLFVCEFVCLSVCLLSNLWSHPRRGSTWQWAGAFIDTCLMSIFLWTCQVPKRSVSLLLDWFFTVWMPLRCPTSYIRATKATLKFYKVTSTQLLLCDISSCSDTWH